MNINQDIFPDDLKNIATSLKNEYGMNFNIVDIIVEFLGIFEKEYIKMLS